MRPRGLFRRRLCRAEKPSMHKSAGDSLYRKTLSLLSFRAKRGMTKESVSSGRHLPHTIEALTPQALSFRAASPTLQQGPPKSDSSAQSMQPSSPGSSLDLFLSSDAPIHASVMLEVNEAGESVSL